MQTTMMDAPLSLNDLLERAGSIFHGNEIVSRLPDKSLRRHSYGEFYRRARALGAHRQRDEDVAVAHQEGLQPRRDRRVAGQAIAIVDDLDDDVAVQRMGNRLADLVLAEVLIVEVELEPGHVVRVAVAQGLEAQRRQLLDGTPLHLVHLLGDVQDRERLRPGQVGGAEQVTHQAPFVGSPRVTRSAPTPDCSAPPHSGCRRPP